MAEIGPKEAAQRANGEATRKRKLIPYAGKDKGGVARDYNRGGHPEKPPVKKRKYRKGPR